MDVFITLALKQIFRKTKTFYKKLESHFLVESTTIKNRSFPYSTSLSKTNVKTNKLESEKWTYYKKPGCNNKIIFSKTCLKLLVASNKLLHSQQLLD